MIVMRLLAEKEAGSTLSSIDGRSVRLALAGK
jgi:hypothetical protein